MRFSKSSRFSLGRIVRPRRPLGPRRRTTGSLHVPVDHGVRALANRDLHRRRRPSGGHDKLCGGGEEVVLRDRQATAVELGLKVRFTRFTLKKGGLKRTF